MKKVTTVLAAIAVAFLFSSNAAFAQHHGAGAPQFHGNQGQVNGGREIYRGNNDYRGGHEGYRGPEQYRGGDYRRPEPPFRGVEPYRGYGNDYHRGYGPEYRDPYYRDYRGHYDDWRYFGFGYRADRWFLNGFFRGPQSIIVNEYINYYDDYCGCNQQSVVQHVAYWNPGYRAFVWYDQNGNLRLAY